MNNTKELILPRENTSEENTRFLIDCIASGQVHEWNKFKIDFDKKSKTRIILFGANLEQANPHREELLGANLYEVNLRWADLRKSNLFGANFTGADVLGADFTGADLRKSNIYLALNTKKAIFDEEQKRLFPDIFGYAEKDELKELKTIEAQLHAKEQALSEMQEKDSTQQQAIEEKEQEIAKLKAELEEKTNIEQAIYTERTNQINSAITPLSSPAKEMTESKKEAQERVDFFNKWARNSLWFAAVSMVVYLFAFFSVVFLSNPIQMNTASYLMAVFPIIFPIIVALALFRQSNLKTKEIADINRRLIMIHEVGQALRATVEINRGKDKDISEKTESILNRLVDNMLNSVVSQDGGKDSGETLSKETLEQISKAVETIQKLAK